MFKNIVNAVKNIAKSITSSVKSFVSPPKQASSSSPTYTPQRQQQISNAFRSTGIAQPPNYNKIASQSTPVSRAFTAIANRSTQGPSSSIQRNPAVPYFSPGGGSLPQYTPANPRSIANALQSISATNKTVKTTITDFGKNIAKAVGQSLSTKDAFSTGTSALATILGGQNAPLSQGFGDRPWLYSQRAGLAGHEGADYAVPRNTPLYNPMDEGEVVDVGFDPQGYGKFVGIRNKRTNEYVLLAHMDKVDVKQGDVIKAGQQVGLSGDTGFSEAPHVHISYTKDYNTRLARSGGFGGFENPLAFLTGKGPSVEFLASNLPESAKELLASGYSSFTASLGQKLADQGVSPTEIASIMQRLGTGTGPTQTQASEGIARALEQTQGIPSVSAASSTTLPRTEALQAPEDRSDVLAALVAKAGASAPPATTEQPSEVKESSVVIPPPAPATPPVALEAIPTTRRGTSRPRGRSGGYV